MSELVCKYCKCSLSGNQFLSKKGNILFVASLHALKSHTYCLFIAFFKRMRVLCVELKVNNVKHFKDVFNSLVHEAESQRGGVQQL